MASFRSAKSTAQGPREIPTARRFRRGTRHTRCSRSRGTRMEVRLQCTSCVGHTLSSRSGRPRTTTGTSSRKSSWKGCVRSCGTPKSRCGSTLCMQAASRSASTPRIRRYRAERRRTTRRVRRSSTAMRSSLRRSACRMCRRRCAPCASWTRRAWSRSCRRCRCTLRGTPWGAMRRPTTLRCSFAKRCMSGALHTACWAAVPSGRPSASRCFAWRPVRSR